MVDYVFLNTLIQIKTFTRVSEIPQKFLKAHTTLQGQVLHVDAIGMLHVKHRPVINVPFSRRLKQVLRPQNQSGILDIVYYCVHVCDNVCIL